MPTENVGKKPHNSGTGLGSPESMAFLVENHQKLTAPELAAHFGVHIGAIRKRLSMMGLPALRAPRRRPRVQQTGTHRPEDPALIARSTQVLRQAWA